MQQGLAEGEARGEACILGEQLEYRFGPLPPAGPNWKSGAKPH
jgi:hypothetical protein